MQKAEKTRQAIYDYICEYIDTNSISPTVREICAAVGCRSTSTVHAHIKALNDAGLISAAPDKRRSITVQRTGGELQILPIVGTVAAGTPILAYDNIIGNRALPRSILHGAEKNEAFLLKVRGDSMINAGILSGDMIIVHTGIAVDSGDIAVARVHGEEATVKRLYYLKDKIRLQPENPAMEPMIFDAGDVEIVGRVIGLIRDM